MVEGLGTGHVLKTHGAIHVHNQDAHDAVLDPGASDAISDCTQLKLLAYVEWTLFVLNVFVIRTALHHRRLVALFLEDTISAPVLILAVSHGNGFNHVSGSDV